MPNGNPMFENIKEIYHYTSDGQYISHGESIGAKGVQVTPPKLAFIIDTILSNKPKSIYDFF